MIDDVELAVLVDWGQPIDPSPPATWMGASMQIEILVGARGCMQELMLFYEVGDAGCLIRVSQESEIISTCIFQRISTYFPADQGAGHKRAYMAYRLGSSRDTG